MRSTSGLVACVAAILTILTDGIAGAQTPRLQEVEAEFPSGIHPFWNGFTDIDGDGDMDCIAASLFPPTSGVWLNDGSGRFSPGPLFGGHVATVIATGDLDGDGLPEVAFDILANVYVSKFLGASFAPVVTTLPSQTGTVPKAISIVDVDNDGRADIVASFGPSPTAPAVPTNPQVVFHNNGNLQFTVTPGAIHPSMGPHTLVGPANLNNDNFPDLVYVSVANGPPSRTIYWLANNGAGVFQSVTGGISTGAYFGDEVLPMGDFNGDGLTDIATAVGSTTTSTVVQLRSLTPTTSTLIATLTWSNGGYPRGVIDVDGNGVDEIVQGFSATAPGCRIFDVSTGSVVTTMADLNAFSVADLDGDGLRDVLAYRYFDDATWRVLINRGNGQFADLANGKTSRLPPLIRPGPGNPISLYDAEGDGDMDVIQVLGAPYLATTAATLLIGRNDGAGNFTVISPLPSVTSPQNLYPGMKPGDFNGDGLVDMGIIRTSSPTTVIWQSNFAGAFTLVPASTVASNPAAQAVADFNNDGLSDFAILETASPPFLKILTNAGGGVFVPASYTSPSITNAGADAVLTADFNGDGFHDVLVSTYGGSGTRQVVIFVNNAGTGFTPTATLAPPSYGAYYSVAIGDVDGDGDLDVRVLDNIYLNNGQASFVAGPTITFSTQSIPDWQLADLNGDGLADIYSRRVWHPATGGGTFGSSQPIRPAAGFGYQGSQTDIFLAADLDRDGDVDLVASETGAVITNMSRHLGRGAMPRLGRTATLELAGPPSTAWQLFAAASLLPAPVTVAPWGAVGIDLASVIAVIPGSFDASGHATVYVPVPQNPSLIGIAVHWQAAIPSIQRVTPRETTSVLPF